MSTEDLLQRSTRYVRLSESRLSFAYHSGKRDERPHYVPWAVRPESSLAVNLREAIESESTLRLPAEQTEVLLSVPVVVVPLADFDEEQVEPQLQFLLPRRKDERSFYDTLPDANCVLLYSAKKTDCEAIETAFGEVHYSACLTHVLRRYATTPAAQVEGRHMLVHLHGTHADVAAYEGQRLLLLNTFTVRAASDVCYYVLNVATTLGFATKQDDILLVGDAALREEALQALRQFAPQTRAHETDDDVPFDLGCAVRK